MDELIVRFAVLTSSDAGSKGERDDASGLLLCDALSHHGSIEDYVILPDEPDQLERQMWQWIRREIDVIFTTGGTGLGPRDVIPEVTRRVIEREVPGISETMRMQSLKYTPFAMISRQVVGVVSQTLIINLPGSPKAVEQLLPVVLPIIPHAVQLIHGHTTHENG